MAILSTNDTANDGCFRQFFCNLKGGSSCPEWLPSSVCLRLWDAAHTPEHDPDDEAVWAEFGQSQARWPAWILMGSALSVVSAATGQKSATFSTSRSIAQAALSGLTIGIYLAMEFFQGQGFLQVEPAMDIWC